MQMGKVLYYYLPLFSSPFLYREPLFYPTYLTQSREKIDPTLENLGCDTG